MTSSPVQFPALHPESCIVLPTYVGKRERPYGLWHGNSASQLIAFAARRPGTTTYYFRISCAGKEALGVPITDLVIDSDSRLSEPVETRARLLCIMKTVRAIEELATTSSIHTLVNTLQDQLVELMPELQGVAPWHSIGQRRSANEMGRTAERVMPVTFARDSLQ